MFDHALGILNSQDQRLPSHAWLPVYDSLAQAFDPTVDPWSFAPVPFWIKQLGETHFGLRVSGDMGEPFAEAGDVLVVWIGKFVSIECLLSERNLWVSDAPSGALRLTENLEDFISPVRRRLGLVVAVLRPQGRFGRNYEVIFELPAAAIINAEHSITH